MRLSILSLVVSLCCFGENRQVPYLLHQGQIDRAISLYQESGSHDLDLLREIAHALIERGASSRDVEEQLIALYGIGMGGSSEMISILKDNVHSEYPPVQLACMQLLAQMGDDSVDDALTDVLHSPHLAVRMESLFHLSRRKSKLAFSQLESLRSRLPEQFGVYFPQLYGMLGSNEAMRVYKQLLGDPILEVRLSTIHGCAQFGRDDLLPELRSALSQHNPAEQESAALAVGALKDLGSMDRLKKLSDSRYESVRLAAALARGSMGDPEGERVVIDAARSGNPFAIGALEPKSRSVLLELSMHGSMDVRLNAILTLLQQGDSVAVEQVRDFLIHDVRDLGFMPKFSEGRTLMAWQVINSMSHQKEFLEGNLGEVSLQLREEMLRLVMSADEDAFLRLADELLSKEQAPLVPMLMRLLGNIPSEKTKAMLKTYSEKLGAPLVRGYALLTLYRLQENQESFLSWMKTQKGEELIRFRPLVERKPNQQNDAPFALTPEVHSMLLLEAFETIAMQHESHCLDLLLDAIKEGHPKNRSALAGLLLKAIQ